MICTSDLQQLADSWTERLGRHSQPLPYQDALSECIYELTSLINHSVKEELDYEEYLKYSYADAYLGQEAHEIAA